MPRHVFLLYALLISNVVLRLFTNKLGLLPRALNIADVFLTISLYLLSLSHSRPTGAGAPLYSFGGRLILFNLVLVAGASLNQKFFYPPAALSQAVMWNEPLLLFLAIIRLPFTAEQISAYRHLLVRLVIIQFCLGVLQIPLFLATGETEEIIGTFSGNAEQYQAFIMIGVFYLFGRQRNEPQLLRKLRTQIAGILFLILLIDNKASWLCILVSLLFVLYTLGGADSMWFLHPRYLLPIFLLIGLGGYTAFKLSPSSGKLSNLVAAFEQGDFINFGKIKAFSDISDAYAQNWQMSLVGSGPGNFYSRTSTQFYPLGVALFEVSGQSSAVAPARTSGSMAGVISRATQPPFFEQYYINRDIYRIGSAQVDSPFSSFAALTGETGVVGTMLYISIYIGILRRLVFMARGPYATDVQMLPFTIAGVGMLAYCIAGASYAGWLETGRMTTIAWAIAALSLHPAITARSLEPASSDSSGHQTETPPASATL